MFRIRKFLVVIPALLFILACQLVSQPLQKAENNVSTAAAVATDLGDFSTQVSGFATNVDDIATQAMEFATDVVGDSTPDSINSPTSGTPPDAWKGIPIMPGAVSSREYGTVYEYTVKATPEEVENFYRSHLEDQGWDEFFSTPYENGAGVLTFTKDSDVLLITYSDNHDGTMQIILTLG